MRAPWRAPEGEVAAILGARHGDAFALLGPHPAPAGQDGFILRAFVPGAEALALLTPAGAQPLGCRHPEGFFEALLPGAPPPPGYRLRASRAGLDWDFADPFGFGPGLGPLDDHLLLEGTHSRLYDRLGAHPVTRDGVAGTRFAVWAPHAARVSVVGSFNAWDGRRHPMRRRADSGIWEIFLPGIGPGAPYKYEVMAGDGRILPLKADPCGFAAELRPNTASLVTDPAPFAWTDAAWMAARAAGDPRRRPLSIYEVHATSWRRHPDGRFWQWDELAAALIPYVADLGFTHVELMPVMEHPLDASWGYQPVGIFAPTARLGGPEGLARFIDAAHAAGIGVILDWVPAHFAQDEQGLARFDGAPLYEHPDPRRGFHPGWGTGVYDYGRPEVAAFLASNALFWLDRFHADGLRVDAVSFMIHLDHGRAPGGWAPNADGSTRNRDAIAFLRRLNALVAREAPGALMIAEEATDFAGVTSPANGDGGLGFGFKWNMGWMNDTLRYMAHDPLQRRWFHGLMNFGLLYAFDEAFILPLSHDEVVHGKGSLLGRMPNGAPDGGGADDWQRFANLRCYYGFMWGHPGKKLLFMGDEIGQWREWSEDRELDWWLLQYPQHRGLQALVRDLNRLHRRLPALHAGDAEARGFQWIDADDEMQSVLTWIRQDGESLVAVLCNLTPVPRAAYRIGLPWAGRWREVLNTDSAVYGGSNLGNLGVVEAAAVPAFGLPASASLLLPPLATVYLVPDEAAGGVKDAEQP